MSYRRESERNIPKVLPEQGLVVLKGFGMRIKSWAIRLAMLTLAIGLAGCEQWTLPPHPTAAAEAAWVNAHDALEKERIAKVSERLGQTFASDLAQFKGIIKPSRVERAVAPWAPDITIDGSQMQPLRIRRDAYRHYVQVSYLLKSPSGRFYYATHHTQVTTGLASACLAQACRGLQAVTEFSPEHARLHYFQNAEDFSAPDYERFFGQQPPVQSVPG